MTPGPTSSPLHSTAKARFRQEAVLAACLLAALTLIYFWKQIVLGQALYWGDSGLYFTPMTLFLRENLRGGHIPLWNPYIYCGTPYVGNPQTWPLYPFTALLPFVAAPRFLSLTVAFHVWLAGLGTFCFARRALSLGFWSALLSSIIFAFGGQLVSKEQFPNMVQAAAYLPWILWMLARLLRSGRVRDALALGAVFGLQLLAAHVQMTAWTLYLAVAYGLYIRPPAPNNGGVSNNGGVRLAGRLLMAVCVGAGLAAGQLLPTLDLFHNAARQNLSFHVVNRFYLPVNQIANFVLPNLHGSPFYGDFSARGNYWETCCSVGWLGFALALWGAYAAWRPDAERQARFWTGVFVFGLWMALGGVGMLYHLAYWTLPGFRNFHDPARCLLWACFALSLLAGYGAESFRFPQNWGLGGDLPLRVGRITLCLLAFSDLAHFGQTLAPLANPADLFPTPPIVAAVQSDPEVQAHQARFLSPSAGIWLRFVSYRDYRQTLPDFQAQRADALIPNLMMSYGLRDAYGYEPVALRAPQTLMGTAAHGFEPEGKPYEHQLAATWAGFLSVRTVITCRTKPPETSLPGLLPVLWQPTLDPPGKHTGKSRLYLSRNARWQPRARVTTDFIAYNSLQAAQGVLSQAALDPRRVDLTRTTVIAGKVPFAPKSQVAPIAATILQDDPDKVIVRAQNFTPALLVLADTEYGGWEATVDGQPAPILTADGCLRAVPLAAAGTHRVVFMYLPTAFLLGLYLSLLTVTILCGSLTALLLQNKFAGRLTKKDSRR